MRCLLHHGGMATSRLLGMLVCALMLLAASAQAASPAVALFYGDNPPWNELRAFDVVVVDPDHPGLDPAAHQHPDSAVFAYASVGEVHPGKPYFKDIPAAWLIGQNTAWGSRVIDQSAPGWPAFFVDKVLAPLWAQGYRGFFLDTLDSWQIVAKTPEQQARQQAGLVATIRAIKARWPEARLIFNRGFEILPQVHEAAWMLAAESLFQNYDSHRGGYGEVKKEDRDWLLGQLRQAQKSYGLPILAIDYVPAEKRELARKTAAKIRDLGFIPWVSTTELDVLGVGRLEVLPRKVLLLYNPAESPDLHLSQAQRFLAMPLAYLGMTIDYRPLTEAPPDFPLTGRYAGIVSWINDDNALTGTAWPAWLQQQVAAGLPLAVFSHFGVGTEAPLLAALGLEYSDVDATKGLGITASDPMMGFELPLRPRPQDFYPLRLRGPGKPLLTLGTPDGKRFQPAALTPWGGYAIAPYVVESLPGKDTGERWYINPLAFLRAALRVDGSVPVPDVTTENGRRLFFSHIDGDGFASLAERPGGLYAGEVLRDEILKRYQLPTTMSVIEGEVGPSGLYPDISAKLEAIARDIYAMPSVEVASHTYSHPFVWRQAEAGTATRDGEYNLPIKGYRFSTAREISGSADYINRRLAPVGKPVKILLWPGDCVATPAALAEAKKAGLLNMNGGDTLITRSLDSWTQIAGLGLEKGGNYQVFAPNQNENVYTSLWHGPFYGFERVIETYEMTDKPYRFKPVDVYFHTYLVTKTAGLTSLQRIYAWAAKQSLHPVFASDYIRKVLDFNGMVVARTPEGYRVRGEGELRTLRIPAPPANLSADWQASAGVVGSSPAPEGRYVAIAGDSADIALATPEKKPAKLPYLQSANARVTTFTRQGNSLRLGLSGHVPLDFTLANADGCTLKAAGKEIKAEQAADGLRHYRMESHAEPALELRCRP